jgi:hypothetical protein
VASGCGGPTTPSLRWRSAIGHFIGRLTLILILVERELKIVTSINNNNQSVRVESTSVFPWSYFCSICSVFV